jgi:CBS domain-containing protein
MKVAEAMTRAVDLLPAETTVQAAAKRMAEQDVGAVLIGSAGDVEGILTDRDVLIRVVVKGADPAAVTVCDVMSSTVFTCREDAPADEAFEMMRTRQIRRLPVMGGDGKVAGVITMSDLARHGFAPDEELLRRIAEPHRERAAATVDVESREPAS